MNISQKYKTFKTAFPLGSALHRRLPRWATPLFPKVFFALVFLPFLIGGCAHTESVPPAALTSFDQVGSYALEGPDLPVVGDLSGLALQGSIQRKAMVGVGRLKLYSTGEPPSLICESIINNRPNEKRRVRGILDCNDGTIILFTLRPLGPDQGLGIGTAVNASGTSPSTGVASAAAHRASERTASAAGSGDPKDLTIFYHPSQEEAERRFPQILADFTTLRQEKRP